MNRSPFHFLSRSAHPIPSRHHQIYRVAADLVRHGENGLIITAARADAIATSIAWCLGHRAELAAMRESALATAAAHQWSDYRLALATGVREALA